MTEMMEKLQKTGIVPVVVLESAEDALPLAERLAEGGLPCAEVTFRTEAAEESIRRMAKAFPEMIIGAGTVLTTEQADRAIGAGATFIVSPGFNPKVTEYVLKKGVPMTPGVCTPTEIEAALQFGLDVLKFFPADPVPDHRRMGGGRLLAGRLRHAEGNCGGHQLPQRAAVFRLCEKENVTAKRRGAG